MVSEKKIFFKFFPYESMGANDTRGVASSGLSDLIKYISSGPHGLREEDFLIFFSIISLWELMIPGAWPVWAPEV